MVDALRGLGPKSKAMLAAAGIADTARLRELGAAAAWLAVRRSGAPASLNLLWGLEAALSSRDWRLVAREDRLRLLSEVEALEQAHAPR